MQIDSSGSSVSSESAHLSIGDIPLLLLRYIEKVKHAVLAHHCQPAVALVECDCLEPFVHFNLGKAEVAIEILADDLEEGETRNSTERSLDR